MKPYTNKTDKLDARKCMYSEIRGSDKARKKAARRKGKKDINSEIIDMPQTMTIEQQLQDFAKNPVAGGVIWSPKTEENDG